MFAVFSAVSAQHPEFARDFSATDITGQQHNLYQYLREDKSVVICFFATWSKTCWAYHNGAKNGTKGIGALQTFYNENLNSAGSSVVVLMIESDAETNLACLYDKPECNLTTHGDWVTDNPLPVIDDAEIAKSFGVKFFPSVITISADGSWEETGTLSGQQHQNYIQQYAWRNELAYDAALHYTNSESPECNGSEIVFDIFNRGDSAINELDIEVSGVIPGKKVKWKGHLEKFESESVNLGEAVLSDQTAFVSIHSPDENPENNVLELHYGATKSTTHIHIIAESENNALNKLSLHIYNAAGTEVLFAGPWPALVDTMTQSVTGDFYLPATGCYKISLVNEADGGVFTQSRFEVFSVNEKSDLSKPLIKMRSENFSHREVLIHANELAHFEPSGTLLTRPAITLLAAEDLLIIEYNTVQPGEVMLDLLTPKGKVVFTKSLGELGTGDHKSRVDISAVAKGAYMLQLNRGGKLSGDRIIIE